VGPALVAAAFRDGRDTGVLLKSCGVREALAALSEGNEEAWRQCWASARHSAKELVVGQLRAKTGDLLIEALTGAGFRVDESAAGLYLWVTRDEPCWETVGWLAERGILVAPGEFYGRAGALHVRVALTATDERVAAAAARLAA